MKQSIIALLSVFLACAVNASAKTETVYMGTGVYWATENLGTSAEYPNGRFYRIGATVPFEQSNPATHSSLDLASVNGSWYGNPQYDAATATLGEGWITPTKEDFDKLLEVCDSELTYDEKLDVTVLKLTSRMTGNSITFTSAGYWYNENDLTRWYKSNLYLMTSTVEDGFSFAFNCVDQEIGYSPFSDTMPALQVRPVFKAPGIYLGDNDRFPSLQVGDKYALTATVFPAAEGTFGWSSSDESVATVDANGVVTALAPGDAEIMVTHSSNIYYRAYSTVTVSKRTVSIEPLEMYIGDKGKLTVNPPLDPSMAEFSWTTSNPSVATVANDGTVTAIGAGTCTVTATNVIFPSITGSCDVTVKGRHVSMTNVELTVPESRKLVVEVTPALDGSVNKYTWTSSNPAVATVTDDGTVKAVGAGKCTVTAVNLFYPSIKASCEVTVTKREISLPSITVAEGNTQQLKFMDSALDESINRFAWTTSDASVATVDAEGNVTGVSQGEAVITATDIVEPSIAAQSTVTVVKAFSDMPLVDMGTGILWASQNVGTSADKPHGSYFRPGATEAYEMVDGGLNDRGRSNIYGDSLRISCWAGDKEYDAATVAMGHGWRTPSKADFEELLAACDVKESYTNGRFTVDLTSRKTGAKLHFVGAGSWSFYNDHTVDPLDVRNLYIITSSGEVGPNIRMYFFSYTAAGVHIAISGGLMGNFLAGNLRPVFDPSGVVNVEEVLLDMPINTMYVGRTFAASAAVKPADPTVAELVWSSTDESVATVSPDGLVSAVGPGSCTITVAATDGTGIAATRDLTVLAPDASVTHAVDLGLSVLWSDKPLGAPDPFSNGDFYQWGTAANMNNFPMATQAGYAMDYVTEPITGKLPDPNDPRKPYDIATATLGEGWMTPTTAQMQELLDNCDRKFFNEGDLRYCRFISRINGNHIEMCAKGYHRNSDEVRKSADIYYQTSDAPIEPGGYNSISTAPLTGWFLPVNTFWMLQVRPVCEPSVGGVDNVAADSEFDLATALFDVYDIAGRRVASSVGYGQARATLTPGIYIFVTPDNRHRLKVHLH